MKKIFTLVASFFTHKRMKTLYWLTGAQFVAGAGDILVTMLTSWNPESNTTIFVGLVISIITKELNKKTKNVQPAN